MRFPNKIDVHAHFIPDFYRTALIDAGHAAPDGMKEIPPWDEAGALRGMDELGIATALLSISSPGVHFGDDGPARRLSRRVNDEAARLVAAHPGRFGFFATLPLPDVEGALREAAHALDVLGANGVVMETNFHGMYLGDARLEPLWAMLNEREAAVFIHPTSPSCACCADVALGYPRPMLEFMFETTRTVVNMMLSGALDRHAALRVIVPHGGAALPALADRVALMAPMLDLPAPVPRGHVLTLLRRLYYDLAGAPVPRPPRARRHNAPPPIICFTARMRRSRRRRRWRFCWRNWNRPICWTTRRGQRYFAGTQRPSCAGACPWRNDFLNISLTNRPEKACNSGQGSQKMKQRVARWPPQAGDSP
jgi:predicted TIM-barrel fold metal-dependent hydrolase